MLGGAGSAYQVLFSNFELYIYLKFKYIIFV